jgi:hypothetical protein
MIFSRDPAQSKKSRPPHPRNPVPNTMNFSPKSLFDIAKNRVLELGLDIEILPHCLQLKTRTKLVRELVSDIDAHEYHEQVGWVGGLNACIQHHVYISSNILEYEKQYSKGFHRQFFPRQPYVLHYIRTDPDFNQRYPQKGSANTLIYARCGALRDIYNVTQCHPTQCDLNALPK